MHPFTTTIEGKCLGHALYEDNFLLVMAKYPRSEPCSLLRLRPSPSVIATQMHSLSAATAADATAPPPPPLETSFWSDTEQLAVLDTIAGRVSYVEVYVSKTSQGLCVALSPVSERVVALYFGPHTWALLRPPVERHYKTMLGAPQASIVVRELVPPDE